MALNFSILLFSLSVISYVTLGGQKGSVAPPQATETIERLELLAEMIEPEESSTTTTCENEPETTVSRCKFETTETMEEPKDIIKPQIVGKKLKCSCTHIDEDALESPETEVEEQETICTKTKKTSIEKVVKSCPPPAEKEADLVEESEPTVAVPEKIVPAEPKIASKAKVIKAAKKQKPQSSKKQKSTKQSKK